MKILKIDLPESLSILTTLGKKLYSAKTYQEKLSYWQQALSPNNPYWHYGEAQGFLLDAPSGQIHVIASCDKRLPGIGFLGFYESDLLEAHDIIQEAESWLYNRGCKKIVAPFDFTILQSYRFNELAGDATFMGEPTNPLYYKKQFEDRGFRYFNHYVSGIRSNYNTILPYTAEADSMGNYHVRSININDYENELITLHALQMKVFAGTSDYFVPFSREELLYWYLPLKNKINVRYVEILIHRDQPVGFCYSFVEGNKLIMKTIGLIPEVRATGASKILIHSQHQKASEDKLEAVIYALVRTGNVVSKMPYPGVEIFRNYFTMVKA